MSRSIRATLLWWAVSMLAVLLAFLLPGCSRREEMLAHSRPVEPPPGAFCGDESYGAVRSAWVLDFYARYRRDLSETLVNWDERFDCNRFVALFAARAQVEYLAHTWHTQGAPQAAAIGEAWVHRPNGDTHALVWVVTEQGEKYFEPQTGKWVDSPGECYFLKL